MGNELRFIDKQVVLYTKGHYNKDVTKQGGVLYLDYFAAWYYDLRLDRVNESIVYNMVMDVYVRLEELGYVTVRIEEMFARLFKNMHWAGDHGISRAMVIRYLLDEMQSIQVYDEKTDELLIDLETSDEEHAKFVEELLEFEIVREGY